MQNEAVFLTGDCASWGNRESEEVSVSERKYQATLIACINWIVVSRLPLRWSPGPTATVVKHLLHEPVWLPPVDASTHEGQPSGNQILPQATGDSVLTQRSVALPSAVDDEAYTQHRRGAAILSPAVAQEAIATEKTQTTEACTSIIEPLSIPSEERTSTGPETQTSDPTLRRNAIVPTENRLFADPETGRVESLIASPRANDTIVTPVEANLGKDSSHPDDERLPRPSHHLVSGGDSPRKEYPRAVYVLREQGALRESRLSGVLSPGSPTFPDFEDIQHPNKSALKSSISESKSSRRNSLGRLLNPVQSISSRIHPVTIYAPTLVADTDSTEDTVEQVLKRQARTDDALKNTGGTLATKTVKVAEVKGGAQSKPSAHSQETIYRLTKASLAEHFENRQDSRNGRLVLRIIFVCIIVNVSALAFETCDGQNRGSSAPGYPYLPDESVYKAIDAFFSSIYSIELVGRTISRQRKRDVLLDPLTYIDFLSLSPWYLQLLMTLAGADFNLDESDGVAHKIGLLRLLRVVRLGYILRHYESMKILVTSLKMSVPPLMVTMFFLFTLVMLLATAIFYADPCYNINTCPFTDIFNSAYFIMVTVATVGYGNQVPATSNVLAMGISFVAMIFGQLYLAMPLAIVGNNFQDAYEAHQQSKRRKLKRQDTTLNPFDSVKLDRKSQRLCEIQYHLLDSWRIVQLNIDKVVRKGVEISDFGGASKDSMRNVMTSGQVQQLEALVDAQIQRLKKIKDAIEKLSDIQTEASSILQSFVPHKREPRSSIASISNVGDGVLSQVLGRAKKAMAIRFSSHDQVPASRRVSQSRRGQLWLALEVPDSSRFAIVVNRIMMGCTLLSVWCFFSESLPELASSGYETRACQRVVESYCKSRGLSHQDGGCFVRFRNNTADLRRPLDFSCYRPTDHATCYGNGLNFGSLDLDALPCIDAFEPSAANLICFRMQCIASANLIVDMEPYWIYFEWLFGFTFLSELLLRFYACNEWRRFLRDFYNIFDILAVLPFVFELCDYAFFGVRPNYAIEATAPSFFSAIRVLKTMRILKLTRHFRGTKVLAQTAKETWRQLLIPVFFLLTICILAAAVYFEIERGTECFVGQHCIWWKKELLQPQLVQGLPLGKRILIQDKQPTMITDMLRSTWLSAATLTNVGYGDIRPRTAMGRMFTICIAVMGTIYTSMPITLVGGKFRTLYARHVEKAVLRKGGSSASWKSNRHLLTQSRHEKDSEPAMRSTELSLLFKLDDEEIDQLRRFQSLKRVLQNLQRQIDNLQEVNRDVLRTIRPTKRTSVTAADDSTFSVSNNVSRRSAGMENAIQERSNAIVDSILQFSSLVEKLQDAPPFYEAFLPEDTSALSRSSAVEALLPPELKNRLLHTHKT